ncbi:uncharacterized protein LOC121644361 [Melanotaenia boesemani]|uniref:uncharacterized protein LOC121644361 n=1 Tax=Melanotaenia boesemani TaxID=1250792 RepID=UPI001C047E9E|nr:uncharacterized protein LOC121644361 [Melanotaenia boesemani]
MAEEILNDSLPDLNELESKIGRKTPESLLIWMRDAADYEDGWRSDVLNREDHNSAFCDSLSDKINNLKQEMRWLRSADVRILRQLVAVHEGIEAMRWLMEDRGTLTSRGSSLTGSLSSLVTLDEHGPSMSPCRESPSPAFPQDLNETTSEKPADQGPSHTDCSDSSRFEMLTSDSSKAKTPSPSSSKFTASHSSHESHGQKQVTSASSLVSANDLRSEKQDLNAAQLQNIKSGAETIRRALQRSSRRRELRFDSGSFAPGRESGEKSKEPPTQQSLSASQSNTAEGKKSSSIEETVLPGYDAQWCWVESQDDVTFL